MEIRNNVKNNRALRKYSIEDELLKNSIQLMTKE